MYSLFLHLVDIVILRIQPRTEQNVAPAPALPMMALELETVAHAVETVVKVVQGIAAAAVVAGAGFRMEYS